MYIYSMSVDYLSLECCNNVPHPVCTALVFTPYSLNFNFCQSIMFVIFCLLFFVSNFLFLFLFILSLSSRPFLSLLSGGRMPLPLVATHHSPRSLSQRRRAVVVATRGTRWVLRYPLASWGPRGQAALSPKQAPDNSSQ